MDSSNILVMGIAWYIIFVFSTVVHEAMHAVVARMGGDTTAENQITLDPIPHMQREPWGMILIPWITFLVNKGGWMFGWASTPFDPMWAARYPHKAARMALAGPLGNLLLAVISGVLLHAGLHGGWFRGGENGQVVFLLLKIMCVLNVILFFFNLLPFPPLDGASAIMLVMPENTARSWQSIVYHPQIQMLTFCFVMFFGGDIVSPGVNWALGLVMS